jgi:hypothetical protein
LWEGGNLVEEKHPALRWRDVRFALWPTRLYDGSLIWLKRYRVTRYTLPFGGSGTVKRPYPPAPRA